MKANSAKSSFLWSMSHKIRTPINLIIGLSQLLSMDNGAPEQSVESAATIRTAANHLLEIVDDILDLSSIESDSIKLTFEPVEVGVLIRECVRAS